jgi:hypothetical protein
MGDGLREIRLLGMENRYPLPLRGTAATTQPLRFARVLETVDAKAEIISADGIVRYRAWFSRSGSP